MAAREAMGKRYVGRLCAYCGVARSTAPDHVFAREFFLPEHRRDLPKVPACAECNNAKATLEHYLTAVLPFGGRHGAASKNLATMVPKRLARNSKLHRSLREKMGRVWGLEGAVLMPASAIPIQAEALVQLFEYVVRGLSRFHWGVVLGREYSPLVISLTTVGEKYFDTLFAMDAASRLREDLGKGSFIYEGAQAIDSPGLSVWRFQIYGGAKFADPDKPGVFSQRLGAICIPREEGACGDNQYTEPGIGPGSQ